MVYPDGGLVSLQTPQSPNGFFCDTQLPPLQMVAFLITLEQLIPFSWMIFYQMVSDSGS